MLNWISNAYNSIFGKIDNTVASWVRSFFSGFYNYLLSIFAPVGKWWHDLQTGFDRLKALFVGWGVQLINHIQDLYNWINKEGALVYDYITHPEKLALFLVDGIAAAALSDAEAIAEKLGEFVLHFIMKNLKQLLTVIETIIDAVL